MSEEEVGEPAEKKPEDYPGCGGGGGGGRVVLTTAPSATRPSGEGAGAKWACPTCVQPVRDRRTG